MQLGSFFFVSSYVCFPHINALLAQMNKGSGSTRILAEANQDRAEREMQARYPEGTTYMEFYGLFSVYGGMILQVLSYRDYNKPI